MILIFILDENVEEMFEKITEWYFLKKDQPAKDYPNIMSNVKHAK